MTIHDSKKSAVSRRWTAALLAAAAAAGPQQEDELWWLTGGSGEHSQADPAAKNPVQLSAPGGDEETPADPEEPGEAYDGPSTVHNEEGFFVKQEDETGHGTWNSLTEKGLWVGGDGDDTGFRVDNDGNVATTGNADIDGTLSASNDKFTVDEKGNLHAKNENARIDLDEAGAYLQSNTTYMGVTDGTATIASGASRVQVTEDGAVFETPDGKTSIKGNAVETGKVTAEKGDIGGVWLKDRNVSNVDKITAEKGDIGDVYLKDGTISAAGGQFTVDETGKVTAEKGDIGDVWMADGKLSADFIQNKNGSFMADGDGNVKMNDATATGDLKVNGDASVDGTLDAGFIKNTDGSFMADGDGNVKMNDATATGDLKVNGDASVDGTQAAAVGGFYHFNEDVMMSVGGATAFEGDHKTAANIGVTFRVGQGSSGKRLSSDAVMAQLEEMNRKIQAMDEKINSLEQKNQDLEAENKELKAEA